MSELGAYIRKAREEKGFSIDDLHHSTKIRRYYLEAIEGGDHQALPNEVYFRGYLRSIARELRSDYEHMLELYEIDAAGGNRVPGVSQAPKQQYEEPGVMARNGRWIGLAVVLGLAAIAAGYYFMIYLPALE